MAVTHVYIIERRVGRAWRIAWGYEPHETAAAAHAALARIEGDGYEGYRVTRWKRATARDQRRRQGAGNV